MLDQKLNIKDQKEKFKIRTYAWTLRLLSFIDRVPTSTVSNVLAKQLTRSGTSVIANYTEAKSASSKKDYINFFTHSLKSANESKVWLTILRNLKKGDSKEINWLIEELMEISNILASSIITLKKKN